MFVSIEVPWARRVVTSVVVIATTILTSASSGFPLIHARADTTTIAGGVEGGVVYSYWPCLFTCGSATLTAAADLTVSGVDVAGRAYTAVWLALNPLAANFVGPFQYVDSCTVGVPVEEDTVNGTFTLDGGLITVQPIGGLPFTEGSARLTGNWSWHREGTALVLSLDGTQLTSGGTTVASGPHLVSGVGTGHWLPTNGPGLCASPVTDQSALVEGVEFAPL